MSIPIKTGVKVISKWSSEGKKQDGTPTTYYNLKVADVVSYDNQIIGVNKDVFDSVEENEDIILSGHCGGLKEKYWYFDSVEKIK